MTESKPGIVCVIYDEAAFVRLQDQLDAARAENAMLRLAVKVLEKLESCPGCGLELTLDLE